MEQMEPMNCDEIGELIPAYALEALPQADQVMLEEHVAGCPDCRTLLAEHQTLAEGLLYTAPPVAAPAHLEGDLRRRLEEARARGDVDRTVSPLRAWLAGLFSPRARPALVVTVLLLSVLAASNLYWAGTTNELRAQQAVLARQLAAQQVGVYALATGGRIVALHGDAPVLQASGILILSPDQPVACLVVEDLPPLPTGKAYQLWLIQDEQRDSGGLFTVDVNGQGLLLVRFPRPLANYQAVGVTVEPARGSPAPTSPPVIGGRL